MLFCLCPRFNDAEHFALDFVQVADAPERKWQPQGWLCTEDGHLRTAPCHLLYLYTFLKNERSEHGSLAVRGQVLFYIAPFFGCVSVKMYARSF